MPIVRFSEAITTCLRRYATFEGRASRSEYWYFALFMVLANLGSAVLDAAIFPDNAVSPLNTLVSLGLLLPSLAAAARRLHDIGRSGWWLMVGVIPVVGWIITLIWLCQRGSIGANRFGADPLAGGLIAGASPA